MKKGKKVVYKFILVAACLSIFFCAAIGMFKGKNPSVPDREQQMKPKQISVGGKEPENGKELPTQRIAVSCLSYYKKGETIMIDAAMGDDYTDNQRFAVLPNYDTFGVNGYPVFSVVDFDIMESVKDSSQMLINGSMGTYEKKFSAEEMQKLDISGEYGNLSKYHHEIVDIDFRDLEPGDAGVISVGFGWYFYQDNPNNGEKPDNSRSGMCYGLGYYVGENGIGLSFNGWEDARNNLEECEEISVKVDDSVGAE